MQRNGRDSIFKRFVGRPRATDVPPVAAEPPAGTEHDDVEHLVAAGAAGLTGAALEQAYRNLLLENVMLAERNERMHERLARQQDGLDESPAARELIRAQRTALAERSHHMRELEYENKQLKREQKKLVSENQQLREQLEDLPLRSDTDLQREVIYQRELEEAQAALRAKTNELLTLTDRYYQLEAQLKTGMPTGAAANGDF